MMITDEMLTEYALPVLLVVLIGFMVFIIWNLGVESKAGKFGMFVLFLGLSVGMLGFVLKFVIELAMSLFV
ncbi:MAG: DUF2788 domain-containing protein [gamma proteobacterium symbiont of Bathyaustriella thionipta]|nr:DUF2788 domain-containing protein [gamma proteobacterium symbiont of Bathyaustriella thionipta]